MIKRFFDRRRPTSAARVPDDLRVYAIGDIHGRLDLLEDLLAKIDDDEASLPVCRSVRVFLGDLVDRGPDSAGVIARLIELRKAKPDTRFLLGNHEEVFLAAIAGSERAIKALCRIGGRETILSYGLTHASYEAMDYTEVAAYLADTVPAAHVEFLRTFEDMVIFGDYAFVHAGVRPGVKLEGQRGADLRWIREPFLSHPDRLEKIIVHGHTIGETVDVQAHRIGIDTGAYNSDRLTALALERDARWIIES